MAAEQGTRGQSGGPVRLEGFTVIATAGQQPTRRAENAPQARPQPMDPVAAMVNLLHPNGDLATRDSAYAALRRAQISRTLDENRLEEANSMGNDRRDYLSG